MIFGRRWKRKNYFWPYAFDTKQEIYKPYVPSKLPNNIAELGNDPYRSAMGLAQKDNFKDPSKGELYFFQFKWGMCAEQLGFIDPLRSDYTAETVTKSVNWLIAHAKDMKEQCVGKGYENMPIPKQKKD